MGGNNQSPSIRIIISGGGTGGHVYPGIAIANELKKLLPTAEITFVGVKNRIEAKIVPREGYPLKTIHVRYLSRKIGLNTIFFFVSLLVGLAQSLLLLLRYRPQVVIGTGGFVSGPVLFAAQLLKIPTLIQEQNSYPGITTKLLARRAKKIHLAFEEAIKYLSKVKDKSRFEISGNPVRLPAVRVEKGAALDKFGLDSGKKTLLLFGGSQGASALNTALLQCLPDLPTDIQLIWQTGELEFAGLEKAVKNFQHKIFIQPFIYNMLDAYSAADLAFCRSGAITIAELVQLGVPAIFVPYPHAAEGHQEKNAQVLVQAGAAEMILQPDLSPKILKQKIMELLFDQHKLDQFKRNLKKFDYQKAAANIARSAINLIPTTQAV